MCQWIGSALVQIMACHLFGAKPLSKPMLCYSQLDSKELQWNFNQNIKLFIHENASENIIYRSEMAAILSRRRWVNSQHQCNWWSESRMLTNTLSNSFIGHFTELQTQGEGLVYNTLSRHDMDTLSALLTLCEGNPLVTSGQWISLKKNQWCGIDIFFVVILNLLNK